MEDFSNGIISPLDLPDAQELEYTLLHPRLKQMFVWSNILTIIILLVLVGFVFLTFSEDNIDVATGFAVLVGIFSIFLILYTIFFTPRVYSNRGYALRAHDITYRHGAIFKKVSTIPFKKVQQVEVVQGLAGKICRLHGLQIITGAQVQSGVTITGLTKEDAERLRAFIIDQANER